MIEALKLAFNVLIRYQSRERLSFRQAQGRNTLWDASRDFEEQPLQGMDGREGAAVSGRGGVDRQHSDARLTTRSWLNVAFAAVVWGSTAYIVRLSIGSVTKGMCLMTHVSQFSSALFFFDAATVHFASATSMALVLYGLYAFSGRGVTAAVSQGFALQVDCFISLRFPSISHCSELASQHLTHQDRISITPFTVTSLSIAHLTRRRLHQCLQCPHNR